MRHDPSTRTYVARRRAEGKTAEEIIRCLKPYAAREVYQAIIGGAPLRGRSIPRREVGQE
jgi:hypothetical protein